MAHQLVSKDGESYLDVADVVERLRGEFQYVNPDREAGADHLGDMIAAFLRMQAPQALIDRHLKLQEKAVYVVVTDDLSSDDGYLDFCLMPEEPLFIGYHSGQHEETARPLLERLATTLNYEIRVV